MLGFGAGWVLGPGQFRHVLRTVVPVTVVDSKTGAVVTIVPIGTPIVGEARPDPRDDVGWMGCIPVTLGTGSEASRLLNTHYEPLDRLPWLATFTGFEVAGTANQGATPGEKK